MDASRLEIARRLFDAGQLVAAVELLEEAAHDDPDDVDILTLLGVSRLRLGLASLAGEAFLAATQLSPSDPKSHFNLGMALRMQGRRQESLSAFQKALEYDPQEPSHHLQVFKQLEQLDRWDDAIRCLTEGLRIRPDSSLLSEALTDAFGRMPNPEQVYEKYRESQTCIAEAYAEWLQQEGRFQESVSVLEQSIARQPLQGPAYRLLAEAGAFQLDDFSLIDRTCAIIDHPHLSQRDQMHLAYALAKARDHAGEWPEAMEAIDRANELAYSLFPNTSTFNAAALAREAQGTEELFDASLFNRLKGSDSRQPIFIVGMIRSGTTLLDQIISSHPMVASAGELPFWNVEAPRARAALRNDPTSNTIANLAEQYRAVLQAKAPDSPYLTDKMPLNFRHLGLIHLAFPRARILHIRRHPVDTCLSMYFTYYGGGPNFAYRKENIVAYYRNYQRLLAHWRPIIPMFELDYETLVSDPVAVTRDLLAFCGLPWDDACLRHDSRSGAVSTPSRWQARQPIYGTSVGRWRRYEPYLGVFSDLLPPQDKTFTK